jgi:DNA polymerase-3 subunit epsilon
MAQSERSDSLQRVRYYAQSLPYFLDTETTGLGSYDEIVEVCLVDSQGKTLFSSLVRPTRRIPADVVWVHGIMDEMVAGAPAWSEVWTDLVEILRGKSVGIYNADFDLRMMRQSHQAHKLVWESDPFRSFCIMKLYAQFYGQRGSYGSSGRWQKLEQAARQCGLQVGATHRALDDALLAKGVFDYMLKAAGK